MRSEPTEVVSGAKPDQRRAEAAGHRLQSRGRRVIRIDDPDNAVFAVGTLGKVDPRVDPDDIVRSGAGRHDVGALELLPKELNAGRGRLRAANQIKKRLVLIVRDDQRREASGIRRAVAHVFSRLFASLARRGLESVHPRLSVVRRTPAAQCILDELRAHLRHAS